MTFLAEDEREDGYKRGLKPATTYCDNVSAKHVVAGLSPRSHALWRTKFRRLISIPSSQLLGRPSSLRAELRRACCTTRNFPRDRHARIAAPLSSSSEALRTRFSSTLTHLRR